MYRIKAFKNAQEFQELFGIQEHGNGVKSRRNKILLAFLKSKTVWNYCRSTGDWSLLAIKDMATLKRVTLRIIDSESNSHRHDIAWSRCYTMCHPFYSQKYIIDRDGICLDGTSGDLGFVRYISIRNNKIYKMSAGKWFNHLLTSTDFGGKVLPQQVLVWLCEQLCEEWRLYVADRCPEYELHVSSEKDAFRRIYNEDECVGDFHSCMTNCGYHTFYYDAVESKAAWLEDSEGYIVARCIIYTNVTDEDGNKWRLAERQYSSDCDDLLKRQLVNALIKAGEIDAYKRVGADCGSASSFEDLEGNSLREKKFHIPCSLELDDTLSYQDSFKWYDYGKQIAYNYREKGSCCDLEETQGYYSGATEWDEYHQEYCYELVYVHYQGNEIGCNVNKQHDFVYLDSDGEYYHYSEVKYCDECDTKFPDPELYGHNGEVFSELTKKWYCCQRCLEKSEESFKEENWVYCSFDDDYVETESELSTYLHLDWLTGGYVLRTVITANINSHIRKGHLKYHNGVLVDNDDKMKSDDEVCNLLCECLIKTA